MKLHRIICLGLGVVASIGLSTSPAVGQIAKQGDAYLLRMKFAPATTAKYMMTMSSKAPQPMNLSMPMVQKVKAVKNGVATVEYTIGPMKGGPTGANQKPQVFTAQVTNRGKVVGTGGGAGMGQQTSIELPEKPVKIGQTWTTTINTPGGPGGGMKMNATYKLVSVSGPYANISVSMTGGSPQMKLSGSGNTILRIADGSMQSTNVKTTVSMTMPAQNGKPASKPMTFSSDVKIVRN